MLNKETLSKQKYIYYVYEADKTIHIERYPIIYMNSKYVYYKHSRKHELERVYVNDVKDTIEDIFKKDYRFIYSRDRYFWNQSENPYEVVAMLKKKADEKRIEDNKSWAEKELAKAKKDYERAQERYKIWHEIEAKKKTKEN